MKDHEHDKPRSIVGNEVTSASVINKAKSEAVAWDCEIVSIVVKDRHGITTVIGSNSSRHSYYEGVPILYKYDEVTKE